MHRLTGPMLAGVALCMSVLLSNDVAARDDGRYANEPLHAWFDQLASGKGLCCSFADGFKVENAVVTEPNKYGPAVVWPYMDANGATQIRCFLPGAGA